MQLIHDLVVHSLAEEEVLYPEFKNMMGSKVSITIRYTWPGQHGMWLHNQLVCAGSPLPRMLQLVMRNNAP